MSGYRIRQSVLHEVDADGVIGGEKNDIEKRFQLVTLNEVLASTSTTSSQPR